MTHSLVTKDWLRDIITHYEGDDLAGHIVKSLQAIEDTRIRVKHIEQNMREAEERHKKELTELKKEREAYRERCTHAIFVYHGDPSGGSDSFHRCEICGHEW